MLIAMSEGNLGYSEVFERGCMSVGVYRSWRLSTVKRVEVHKQIYKRIRDNPRISSDEN
jgi:hypothetical protein